MKSCPTLIALVLALSTLSQAQEANLVRIYPEGSVESASTEVTTSQSLAIAGMEIKTSNRQTVTIESAIGKRSPDGTFRIERKILGVKANMSLPGVGDFEIDSAKPIEVKTGTELDALANSLNAMHGASWTEIRGKDNRVIRVELRREIPGQREFEGRGVPKRPTRPRGPAASRQSRL